jgi:hypothetical protein
VGFLSFIDLPLQPLLQHGKHNCKHATGHNLKIGGKEWEYLLIPNSVVLPNMSVGYLAGKRTFVGEAK